MARNELVTPLGDSAARWVMIKARLTDKRRTG